MATAARTRQQQHYGLGFWLDGPAVELHGGDYGVSFVSSFGPSTGATCTVIANLQTPIRALVRKLRDLASTTS